MNSARNPPVCVAREITEETGLPVTTGPILDAWQYHISDGRDVLIVTYGCHPEGNQSPILSNEHKEIGFFTQAEVAHLKMPAGYKHSIRSWFARVGTDDVRAPDQAAYSLTNPPAPQPRVRSLVDLGDT